MSLTWNGLLTVTKLEIAQRVRSKKMYWALAGWFVLIGLVTLLVMQAFARQYTYPEAPSPGPMAFAMITYFVLGLGGLIAPTFTATSINGDRQSGTLALLQATKLSALEIAGGKLLAAWLTALAFLVAAIPFIAWSMALGNISVWQVVVCFAVMLVLIAAVCAFGLGWSALIGRPAGSTVLTYLTIVAITVIAPIMMVLGVSVSTDKVSYRVWALPDAVQAEYQMKVDQYYAGQQGKEPGADFPAPPLDQCTWVTREDSDQPRPDRLAWLLVPNPFVVVADAAPLPPNAGTNLSSYAARSNDGLAFVSYGVRSLMRAPSTERDECLFLYEQSPAFRVERDALGNVIKVTTSDGTPVNVESPVKRQAVTTENPLWPWGLGFNVLLGALFFGVAVKRLSVPYGVLPKGTRVA